METDRSSIVGGLLLMSSYVFLLRTLPPVWVPWDSPVGLFGIIAVVLVAMLVAIFGGILVVLGRATEQPSKLRTLAVAVGGPIGATIPIYAYLVTGGWGPFAPVFRVTIAFAVIVGLATGVFAFHRETSVEPA